MGPGVVSLVALSSQRCNKQSCLQQMNQKLLLQLHLKDSAKIAPQTHLIVTRIATRITTRIATRIATLITTMIQTQTLTMNQTLKMLLTVIAGMNYYSLYCHQLQRPGQIF